MKSKTILGIFILILATIFLISIYSYSQRGFVYSMTNEDIDSIVEDIRSFGHLAAIAIFLLVIIEVVAAPLPPLILYVASGIIFGGFVGGIIVIAGNILGSAIAFLFARKVGKDFINEKIGKRNSKKLDRFSERHGPFAIFLLRINPFTSSDIVSYFAGLSRMRFSHFIISTTLGLIPLVFSQTYLGSDIIKQSPFLFSIILWLSVAYFILIIYLFFRLLKTKTPKLITKNKSQNKTDVN